LHFHSAAIHRTAVPFWVVFVVPCFFDSLQGSLSNTPIEDRKDLDNITLEFQRILNGKIAKFQILLHKILIFSNRTGPTNDKRPALVYI
jgi:hypothetical protein